jgi:hypothetical protein
MPRLRLSLRMGIYTLRRLVWTAGVGTWSLLWNNGRSNRGILVRIDSFVIVNDLRVVVNSSFSSEIGFCNILGPDTSISTHVLPEGQCGKETKVGQHCNVFRRRKEEKKKKVISIWFLYDLGMEDLLMIQAKNPNAMIADDSLHAASP